MRHTYGVAGDDAALVDVTSRVDAEIDLLGHASIVTTERYDNQKPEALMAAAKRLESGESFKNVSSQRPAMRSEQAGLAVWKTATH